MIVPYYPEDSAEDYNSYYLNQAGHGFNVFKGSTVQTGYGIGSFLGRIARSAMPIMKTVAKKALSTGVAIARDALSGQDVGKSAIRHAKTAGAGLLGALSDQLHDAGNVDDEDETPKKRRRANKTPIHEDENGILSRVRIQE